MVPSKYLTNLWRTFEILLISCEINLNLSRSKNCVIVANNADQSTNLALDAHRKAIQLILLGIYVEQQVPQCFVFLMKQKKLFGFFKRSIISFNIYKLTTE